MDASTGGNMFELPTELTILTLSAPYLDAATASINDRRRSSNSSSGNRSNATPAILAADLTHYQDLFSKLRFSYVEQVTKERFLRAVTSQQPDFVEPTENVELQERLVAEKAALKERKKEVREIVEALEEQAGHLAGRYESIQLQTTQLEELPGEIAGLEETIASLRAQTSRSNHSTDPDLSLPLQPTHDLLSSRQDELSSIDAQIEALQAALPGKQAQVKLMRDEVGIAEARKVKAVAEAQDARRRRDGGNSGGLGMDELEEQGRWLRGVEAGLKGMLEV